MVKALLVVALILPWYLVEAAAEQNLQPEKLITFARRGVRTRKVRRA